MADNCKLCRIALENVSVVRGGQTLLQDVSMHIHCGQLTVLIGQNGAGKRRSSAPCWGNTLTAVRFAMWTAKGATWRTCARGMCRSIWNSTRRCL